MRTPLFVALRESLHFKASTVAQVAIIAGLVVPLLLLLALERSLVSDLRAHLRSFPENLQLSARQSVSRPVEWFAEMREDPRVGFIALHPYENADYVELDAGRGEINLLASGPGDPWLKGETAPPSVSEAVITQALSESLSLSAGDTLDVVIKCGVESEHPIGLTVTGIVPRSYWLERGALVNESFLVELYLCRMGYRSDLFDAGGDTPPDAMTFPRFRLYASSLEDIRPLASDLQGQGIFVTGQFAAADLAESISRTAGLVTLALVLALAGGSFVALAGMLLSDARRMRPALATLRVDGLSVSQAVQVIAIKTAFVSLVGIAAGLAGYIGLAGALNAAFAAHPLPFETLVRLSAAECAGACAGVFCLAVVASAGATFSTLSVSPMEDQNAQ